ncbi:uncharacterized protein LOC115764512 [Drosophila novamexicana]|uniref:uncharacterized protein LOC115764512 n=1 Tax=Drosophila novamexicana TaxID=47314 RepID=UPI0011E58A66|nr:uncharacterized protein LOC115764512 [Drosophila novamexicana]
MAPISNKDSATEAEGNEPIIVENFGLPSNEKVDGVHLPELDYLIESVANCQKPLCDDADLECVSNMVNATICEAIKIIESDPRGLFCYKYPKTLYNVSDEFQYPVTPSMGLSDISSDFVQQWLKIGEFEYNNVLAVIRDFIGKWQLSPKTKCVVLTNTRRHDVALKGTIYFVDAHFSRPTQRCPNPLAVAKVRFIITVSTVMQKYYPVMITYRFEGYRTLYYAVGDRALTLNTFQRFYIDTILHTKLSFYAEICECRHGTIDKPKNNVKSKNVKKTS